MNSKWMKLVCSKIFGQRRQISSWFINGNQDKYQELRNSILCVKILDPCHVQPQNSSSLTLMWAGNSSLSCTLANNKTIRQKYHIYRSKYHFTFVFFKTKHLSKQKKMIGMNILNNQYRKGVESLPIRKEIVRRSESFTCQSDGSISRPINYEASPMTNKPKIGKLLSLQQVTCLLFSFFWSV